MTLVQTAGQGLTLPPPTRAPPPTLVDELLAGVRPPRRVMACGNLSRLHTRRVNQANEWG